MIVENTIHAGDQIDVLLDYWDNPISGIVLTTRRPYYFQALFDTALDSYSSTYQITIISDGTRQLAVDVERRWQRMSASQRRERMATNDYDRALGELKESIARDQQELESWLATAHFVDTEGGRGPELPARVIWSRNSAR
jgi:hypothetical protein